MRGAVRFLLPLAILGFGIGPAGALDVIAPLVSQPPGVGVLFLAIDQAVLVTVEDRREGTHLIGGGVMGPGFESGSGPYMLYATESDSEIAAHLKSAAEEAVKVLGFKVGDGGLRLSLRIDELWVDMHRMSAFAPMNCIAYATLQTTLVAPDLPAPEVRTLRLTFWEETVPVGSMKEVTREAVSLLHSEAAWQAVTAALLARRESQGDPGQVRRVLERIGMVEDEEVPSRLAIFWLGITHQTGADVKEKLLGILGQSEEYRLRRAAAEALGLLGAQEAASELLALLNGKAPGTWDNTDAAQAWYLLHGLALLGRGDLRSAIPATAMKKMKASAKTDDLILFHEGGRPPALNEKAAAKLAKAKAKLAKKRS